MQKRETVPLNFYKLAYLLYRRPVLKKKVCSVNGQQMSEEDFEKYMNIINQCKK